MVMMAQSTMKSKLQAFFIFSSDGGYVFRFRFTVATGNIWGWGHISASVTYLIATSEASTAVAIATAPQAPLKQHGHADLIVCINPLLRSPAQTHVFEFKCLPLSHFHSQIPFKLCIPFLYTTPLSALGHHVTPIPMLSPVASTQCLRHSP